MSGVSPTVVIGEAFDSKNAAQSLRRVFSLITKAKDFGSRNNPPSGIFKDSMVKSRQRIDQTDLSEADIKAGLRTGYDARGFNAGRWRRPERLTLKHFTLLCFSLKKVWRTLPWRS